MTRNKNNKGFTLVELIVVLAILAILAAMLVPSLTGYIDKAKEKKEVANARLLLEATQATISELYALDHKSICNAGTNSSCSIVTPVTNAIQAPPVGEKRYYNTYELASDVFKQTKHIYIATLSSQGKAIRSIYYEENNSHMLLWTLDSQQWEIIEYNDELWIDMYEECGASRQYPYWNAREGFNPRNH